MSKECYNNYFIYLFILFIYYFIYLLFYLFIISFIYYFIYLLFYLFIISFIYYFIYLLFIYYFIYLLFYLFIFFFLPSIQVIITVGAEIATSSISASTSGPETNGSPTIHNQPQVQHQVTSPTLELILILSATVPSMTLDPGRCAATWISLTV